MNLKFLFCVLIFDSVNISKSFNISPQPNAIFRHPVLKTHYPPTRSSYFGFSLVLRENSLIVGAPRAQSHLPSQRGINETGAVYKCSWLNANCVPYVFDSLGNITSKPDPLHFTNETKSHQWMGGAMDGGSKDTDKLIVCAPRLVNAELPEEYYMHGVCYCTQDTIGDKPKVQKISALTLKEKQRVRGFKEDIEHYMLGEQGLSVHLTDNNEEFIIGAPGINAWKGTVVRTLYNRRTNQITNEVAEHAWQLKNMSYSGYDVSSGYYNSAEPKKLLYLASAPKAINDSGLVFIFDIAGVKVLNNNEQRYFTLTLYNFNSPVFGQYFGYSILTEDVNGDGLPDVIISAPLYSTGKRNYEIGAIYVYINKGKLKFTQPVTIVSPSTTKNGRFGSTLTRLGDINQDGYNDIAVGAPFDGDGAVYIYLGGKKGIRKIYSQILRPPKNTGTIAGGYMFGHGLSRGVDIDSNFYNDLAIGAPNAEMVYLYRSYPVVKIIASVKIEGTISKSNPSFEIRACYRIKTKFKVHEVQELKLRLLVDSKINRAQFESTKNYEFEYNVNASSKTQCDRLKVNINLNSTYRDVYKPIKLQMYYEVANKVPLDSQQFCEKCVTVDPNNKKIAMSEIVFSSGCKNDVCVADLKVSSINLNSSYTLGSSRALTVEYEIENTGETAYLPQINFTSSKGLEFNKVPQSCSQDRNDILLCYLNDGQFMPKGGRSRIKVHYDVSELNGNSLQLTAEVFSSGKEANSSDNVVVDVIKLLKFSEVEVISNSSFDKVNLEDFSDKINITNSFDISNIGPSDIDDMVLGIYVPVAYITPKTMKQISIIDTHNLTVDAKLNGQKLDVFFRNSSTGYSSTFQENVYDSASKEIAFDGTTANSSEKQQIELNSTFPKDESKLNYSKSELTSRLPINRTILLSCNQEFVQCVRFSVNISDFQVGTDNQVLVRIGFDVNVSETNKVLGRGRDFLVIETFIHLEASNDEYINNTSIKMTSSYIHNVLFKYTHSGAPWWLLLFSAILGFLILVALTFGLKSCGFFKRNRPVAEESEQDQVQMNLTEGLNEERLDCEEN